MELFAFVGAYFKAKCKVKLTFFLDFALMIWYNN